MTKVPNQINTNHNKENSTDDAQPRSTQHPQSSLIPAKNKALGSNMIGFKDSNRDSSKIGL